jgi:hypothetical protein
MAAGLAGLLFLLYNILLIKDELTLRRLKAARVSAVFETRDEAVQSELSEALRAARNRVEILGFGLRNLREVQADGLEALVARAKVRILLIDPEFPSSEASYADQRDIEEGERGLDQTREEVEQFVRYAAPLILREREADSPRLEVRLFRCLPSISILRVDDAIFWGPYLMAMASRRCLLEQVESGGFAFHQVQAHFESIWADESRWREVPAEWLA